MTFALGIWRGKEEHGRTRTNSLGYTGSKYIYDLYYEKEAIDRKLYEWLLKNGYADANLIAKWKKQGYEKVRQTNRTSPYVGTIS